MKRIPLKTDQNHPLIKAYKEAVEKGMKNLHILYREDGSWIITRADSPKANQVFNTQQEAIEKATTLAQTLNTSLFVHGEDGRIKNRLDF